MKGPQLGQLIGKSETPARDAIHVAVVAVRAAEDLMPGDHVGKVDKADGLLFGRTDTTVGVVDPFLKEPVSKGDWFWLCLYPGSITSLRHDWSHPDFAPETVKVKLPEYAHEPSKVLQSKVWLQMYSDEVGVSYDELMAAGEAALETGAHYVLGEQTPDVVYEKSEEFWEHFAVVTGKEIDAETKEHQVFACAC